MTNSIKALFLLIALTLSACAQNSGNTPDLPNTQPSDAQVNQMKLEHALQS